MLLGIALHASLSFFAAPWPVHDTQRSDLLPLFLVAVHGFRMPLFFLLSGYFTMFVYRRRGLKSLLEQRFIRIFLPLVIATATIVPLDMGIKRFAHRTIRPEPAIEEILSGNEAAVRQRLATPGRSSTKTPSTAARRSPGPRWTVTRRSWQRCSMPAPTSMSVMAAGTRPSMESPTSATMRRAECSWSEGRIHWPGTLSVGSRRRSWRCQLTSPPNAHRSLA
jgi:hypothetical protein